MRRVLPLLLLISAVAFGVPAGTGLAASGQMAGDITLSGDLATVSWNDIVGATTYRLDSIHDDGSRLEVYDGPATEAQVSAAPRLRFLLSAFDDRGDVIQREYLRSIALQHQIDDVTLLVLRSAGTADAVLSFKRSTGLLAGGWLRIPGRPTESFSGSPVVIERLDEIPEGRVTFETEPVTTAVETTAESGSEPVDDLLGVDYTLFLDPPPQIVKAAGGTVDHWPTEGPAQGNLEPAATEEDEAVVSAGSSALPNGTFYGLKARYTTFIAQQKAPNCYGDYTPDYFGTDNRDFSYSGKFRTRMQFRRNFRDPINGDRISYTLFKRATGYTYKYRSSDNALIWSGQASAGGIEEGEKSDNSSYSTRKVKHSVGNPGCPAAWPNIDYRINIDLWHDSGFYLWWNRDQAPHHEIYVRTYRVGSNATKVCLRAENKGFYYLAPPAPSKEGVCIRAA